MPKMVSNAKNIFGHFILMFIIFFLVTTVLTAFFIAILEVSLEDYLYNVYPGYIQLSEDILMLIVPHIATIVLAIKSSFKKNLITVNEIDKFVKYIVVFLIVVWLLYGGYAIFLYDLALISFILMAISLVIYVGMFFYIKKLVLLNTSSTNVGYGNNNARFKVKSPKKPKKLKKAKGPVSSRQNYRKIPNGPYPVNYRNMNNHYNNNKEMMLCLKWFQMLKIYLDILF